MNKENLGMNERFDKDNLPSQYEYQPQPYYKGDGSHSIKELQELCNKFTEYCHQQAIIKQQLIEEVKLLVAGFECKADADTGTSLD